MASSGGMWHNAKSGGRVAAKAGESRAKASGRAEGNAFKKIMAGGMKKTLSKRKRFQ